MSKTTIPTVQFMETFNTEAKARQHFERMPKLSGIVEVDETYIGGKETNKHEYKKLRQGGGSVGKVAVMGLRERGGRVKAMPIRTPDKSCLHGGIRKHVEVGSIFFAHPSI